jgi:hypothetical protein
MGAPLAANGLPAAHVVPVWSAARPACVHSVAPVQESCGLGAGALEPQAAAIETIAQRSAVRIRVIVSPAS